MKVQNLVSDSSAFRCLVASAPPQIQGFLVGRLKLGITSSITQHYCCDVSLKTAMDMPELSLRKVIEKSITILIICALQLSDQSVPELQDQAMSVGNVTEKMRLVAQMDLLASRKDNMFFKSAK